MKWKWREIEARFTDVNCFGGSIVSEDERCPGSIVSRSVGFSVCVARWNPTRRVQHVSDRVLWSEGCWEIRNAVGEWLGAEPEWRPKWVLVACDG